MKDKVMSIGIVSDLTGLTERQIRYYEEKQLVFPVRTKGGARKYSFEDVDRLKEINDKLRDGFHTFELRKPGRLCSE
ncbi:MerR family transcriptional regulator [Paenibacillus glycanilyticus]|uniref:MerR family transcriptional regulator n=1 Tax=Paenibacillus TaxID=44249 RepID=UPI0001664AA4|nr:MULTISPECIES: MerR family transcriptional regulator [Paenibacillus]ACT03765.1 transcriptional regulator, MerR family [Paenibacillus sp. JDR-2]MCM3630516.1 MerR family transcriptional regulator [Paenibacillus glycanilyticus]